MDNAAQKRAWSREYAGTGFARIESSYSSKPEACIFWFKAMLFDAGLRYGRLLDVGCGRGRNSLPFLKSGWQVTGADTVAPALAAFKRSAAGSRGELTVKTMDFSKRWPLPDNCFDAGMEITAADNLFDQRSFALFWQEAVRVLRPGGFWLSYFFNPADGYYGPLLRQSPRRAAGVLFDPKARMRFRFYTADQIVAAAANRWRFQCQRLYHYPGPMFGKTYERDLTAAVFYKPALDGQVTA